MNNEIANLIGDLLHFSPKTADSIYLARLRTYRTSDGIKSTQDFNTALVSPKLVHRLKPSQVSPVVTLRRPSITGGKSDRADLSLYLSRQNGLRNVEPLVLSWNSGSNTTLTPDQGLLATYALIPRPTENEICWDDLKRPKYDVVNNQPRSFYNSSDYSDAYVKMDQLYFQDYVECRQKVAIQVFQEIREISTTPFLEGMLGDKTHWIYEYASCEIRATRLKNAGDLIRLEVNGFRVLHDPEKSKGDFNEERGHTWKGVNETVTWNKARHYSPLIVGYVSDAVLERYEFDDDYDINPMSGCVSYANQWGITHCRRVGRNHLQIELKKLYEGAPDEVIAYWNKFSVHPEEVVKTGTNVAQRADKIITTYLLIGHTMCDIVNELFSLQIRPMQLIKIDFEMANQFNLLKVPSIKPITYHINSKSFSRDQFIARCKNLHIVLTEGFGEKYLRKIINSIGFEKDDTKSFRSLKLLNLLLSFFSNSLQSGLSLRNDRQEILNRTLASSEFKGLEQLFALNQIRQLDAHRKGKDFDQKLHAALKVFSIDFRSISNNYAEAMDQVYDELLNTLRFVNNTLLDAHSSIFE